MSKSLLELMEETKLEPSALIYTISWVLYGPELTPSNDVIMQYCKLRKSRNCVIFLVSKLLQVALLNKYYHFSLCWEVEGYLLLHFWSFQLVWLKRGSQHRAVQNQCQPYTRKGGAQDPDVVS